MRRRAGIAALAVAALLAAAPAFAQEQMAPKADEPVDYVVDAALEQGMDLSKLPQGTIVEYLGLGCPGAIALFTLRVPPAQLAEVRAFIERFAWKGHITKF